MLVFETSYDLDELFSNEDEMSIEEFIEKIQSNIPKGKIGKIRLGDSDYFGIIFELNIYREETPKETHERQLKEIKRKQMMEEKFQKEAKENRRKMWENLKKEFGE